MSELINELEYAHSTKNHNLEQLIIKEYYIKKTIKKTYIFSKSFLVINHDNFYQFNFLYFKNVNEITPITVEIPNKVYIIEFKVASPV